MLLLLCEIDFLTMLLFVYSLANLWLKFQSQDCVKSVFTFTKCIYPTELSSRVHYVLQYMCMYVSIYLWVYSFNTHT